MVRKRIRGAKKKLKSIGSNTQLDVREKKSVKKDTKAIIKKEKKYQKDKKLKDSLVKMTQQKTTKKSIKQETTTAAENILTSNIEMKSVCQDSCETSVGTTKRYFVMFDGLKVTGEIFDNMTVVKRHMKKSLDVWFRPFYVLERAQAFVDSHLHPTTSSNNGLIGKEDFPNVLQEFPEEQAFYKSSKNHKLNMQIDLNQDNVDMEELVNEVKKLKNNQVLLETQLQKSIADFESLESTINQLEKKISFVQNKQSTSASKSNGDMICDERQEEKFEKLSVHNEFPSSRTNEEGDILLQFDNNGFCAVYVEDFCYINCDEVQLGIGVWFGDSSSLNLSQPLSDDCKPSAYIAILQAATYALNVVKLAGIQKINIHSSSAFVSNKIQQLESLLGVISNKKFKTMDVSYKNHFLAYLNARLDMDVEWTNTNELTDCFDAKKSEELAKSGAKICTPRTRKQVKGSSIYIENWMTTAKKILKIK